MAITLSSSPLYCISPDHYPSFVHNTGLRSSSRHAFKFLCLLPYPYAPSLQRLVPSSFIRSVISSKIVIRSSFSYGGGHNLSSDGPWRRSYLSKKARTSLLLPQATGKAQVSVPDKPRKKRRNTKRKVKDAPSSSFSSKQILPVSIGEGPSTSTCIESLELNGNPLGRKSLGKEVVKWIGDGMAYMAAEIAAAEENADDNELEEKMASGLSFVMQAQHYLNMTPMPIGFEALCLQASTHYPTLFDHFQRELQKALGNLQAKGVMDNWKNAKAWQLLKLHAKSGSHRVIARKAPETKQLHEELGLSRDKITQIQKSIDQFVCKMIDLLQIERNAELEATQVELNASPSVGDNPAAGPTDYLVYHGQSEQEQCDTICNLVAVSSSTGLGGIHIVTFQVEGGNRLPPTNISPGDMVCIRAADGKGLQARECLKGFVHSLGEDGSTISAAIEARYGDPVFSKLFGKPLRIDRISALADPITYERNLEALQQLQKFGLHKKNPAAAVVATFFGEGPDICWLAQHGPPSSSSLQNNGNKDIQYQNLDESQKKAVELGLNRNRPVVVIQGPPGTGKTKVICRLIEEAVSRGERVLATAPTNAAVDNLVERLSETGMDIVRIGNPFRVAPAVTSKSLSAIVESKMADFQKEFARRRADLRTDLRQCLGDDSLATGIRQLLKQLSKSLKQKEKEVVDETLRNAQVILSTNTTSGEPLVQNLPTFDLVIIDEAAQAVEPACWIPLLKGKRAVLAGDPCQLAPVILSREALEGGLGISLMERACSLHDGILRTFLDVQYRMNDSIASWSSKEMYSGALKSSPVVSTHLLADATTVKNSWITRTPLLLLDTRLPFGSLAQGCEECLDPAGTGSFYNEGEAEIVISHVNSLISAGVPPSSIVVQSPYVAQVQLLRDRIEDLPKANGVQIASVDSFQGREADAVIISMVRSNKLGAVGFLGDRRRINVAITRARKHVVVVCDSSTISNNKFLLRLLQHIRKNGIVRVAGSGDLLQSSLPNTRNESPRGLPVNR